MHLYKGLEDAGPKPELMAPVLSVAAAIQQLVRQHQDLHAPHCTLQPFQQHVLNSHQHVQGCLQHVGVLHSSPVQQCQHHQQDHWHQQQLQLCTVQEQLTALVAAAQQQLLPQRQKQQQQQPGQACLSLQAHSAQPTGMLEQQKRNKHEINGDTSSPPVSTRRPVLLQRRSRVCHAGRKTSSRDLLKSRLCNSSVTRAASASPMHATATSPFGTSPAVAPQQQQQQARERVEQPMCGTVVDETTGKELACSCSATSTPDFTTPTKLAQHSLNGCCVAATSSGSPAGIDAAVGASPARVNSLMEQLEQRLSALQHLLRSPLDPGPHGQQRCSSVEQGTIKLTPQCSRHMQQQRQQCQGCAVQCAALSPAGCWQQLLSASPAWSDYSTAAAAGSCCSPGLGSEVEQKAASAAGQTPPSIQHYQGGDSAQQQTSSCPVSSSRSSCNGGHQGAGAVQQKSTAYCSDSAAEHGGQQGSTEATAAQHTDRKQLQPQSTQLAAASAADSKSDHSGDGAMATAATAAAEATRLADRPMMTGSCRRQLCWDQHTTNAGLGLSKHHEVCFGEPPLSSSSAAVDALSVATVKGEVRRKHQPGSHCPEGGFADQLQQDAATVLALVQAMQQKLQPQYRQQDDATSKESGSSSSKWISSIKGAAAAPQRTMPNTPAKLRRQDQTSLNLSRGGAAVLKADDCSEGLVFALLLASKRPTRDTCGVGAGHATCWEPQGFCVSS